MKLLLSLWYAMPYCQLSFWTCGISVITSSYTISEDCDRKPWLNCVVTLLTLFFIVTPWCPGFFMVPGFVIFFTTRTWEQIHGLKSSPVCRRFARKIWKTCMFVAYIFSSYTWIKIITNNMRCFEYCITFEFVQKKVITQVLIFATVVGQSPTVYSW